MMCFHAFLVYFPLYFYFRDNGSRKAKRLGCPYPPVHFNGKMDSLMNQSVFHARRGIPER